ncbi:uncharacterized protein NECHADRAFT_76564 [Fusarium vanettenii 77-13-4]|uniref:Uncharacterized protein n=1 Tax=Fusarium vanettenii (strain ATCC MYA-4622 / CBS 123669 / FGSC 9596 / NRRL 45880 / 77-13-4) TaxID=660122 RepID=C7Z4L6_FUSV7|nr:uncharacterized protein NECHADRAFT_76564 [Fusarium vanettenii 77-13-4]EEU40368.1 predicted protein [Fusarium vanettenii 77-13-4]
MADQASNHDEGFSVPPAPTIAPEFAHEWLDLEHRESVSAVHTVLLARQHYIAAQNHHIMLQLENLHLANSRTQSRRSSMSSAAASTEGGDDARIAPIPGARVQEAFDELRTGELQGSSRPSTIHLSRSTTRSYARTFIEHVTQAIKEKQANPEGQEA